MSDIVLASKVKAALADEREIAASQVKVKVHEGVVSLSSGQGVTKTQRDLIEQVAKMVDGVKRGAGRGVEGGMIGLDLGTVAAGSLPVVYSNLIGSVGFFEGLLWSMGCCVDLALRATCTFGAIAI